MPNRFNNTGGFGGFGGTPNPFMRYPGGVALESDIGQARDAMMFGGDGGLPRAVIPATTPAPVRTAGGGDPSGAGFVNRRLFRQDNRANQEFWEAPRNSQNRPHEAVTVDDSTRGDARMATREPIGAEAFATVPHVGEPIIEIPTQTGRVASNLDNEPSLFPENMATNAFDEWWKGDQWTTSGNASAGAAIDLSGAGGSIWAENPPDVQGSAGLADFDTEPVSGELVADVPWQESPFAPVAEGTGIPVEPDPLNQDVGDLVWQTSEDDRRFLPDPNESETSTASTGGGPNIRDFGGHSFDNRLTLGAYLNMPIAALRYGTDRYVSGGDVITPGSIDHTNPSGTPLMADTGTTTPPPATGQVQIDPQTGRPYDLGSIPEAEGTGNTVFNDQNSGPLSPTYVHAPVTARDPGFNYGYGQSRSSQENARLMDAVAMWGFAAPLARPDMPISSSIGGLRLDSEGGFEQVGFGRVGGRLTTAADRARSRQLTTAQGRAAAVRGG